MAKVDLYVRTYTLAMEKAGNRGNIHTIKAHIHKAASPWYLGIGDYISL